MCACARCERSSNLLEMKGIQGTTLVEKAREPMTKSNLW